ncbi:TetR/AcrR family transcriptional regulator [Mycobacterium sp. shizuoka-1]|uniref:TetR/AcrR family transcriptional regulator n=1 Tax=Mycobacterium sp. shizuoka-1 TaxID=2039281 RepID=UPI000C0643DF|nr:TetR family transcriptional regulator [Mycobacterium sp. shizuoka-1]GAY14525.1 TetR family transcriptional regulator [Mycobacterium sp. shizuoka-1]
MTAVARPERGTRPANRRAMIVMAATELFCVRGYEHVAMGDIADAVAVGASALYRHFSSKHQLLEEVVFSGLDSVTAVVGRLDAADVDRSVLDLAELAVSGRHIGILVEREARHLSQDAQARLGHASHDVARRLSAFVETARADVDGDARDLFAWMILGVVVSPSFYQSELSAKDQSRLLAELVGRVVTAPAPAGFAIGRRPRPPAGLLPNSRREALLQQAIRLFAERRYASVGIEDVAASLGIAGPSVYNHFANKADLLATALSRGAAYLYMQAADALAVSTTPAAALRSLIASYVEFALGHPALVDLLMTEVRNLPEPHRAAALAAQRDYVEEWVHLLRQFRAEASEAEARLQVQALLTLVNYVARVPHLQSADGISGAVGATCAHLLSLPQGN